MRVNNLDQQNFCGIDHSRRAFGRRRETAMSQRELIEPHKGDKRYQRRKDDGTFAESDDQTASLRQDVKRHAQTRKPRGEGDKGD
jgi:hypothetical protein